MIWLMENLAFVCERLEKSRKGVFVWMFCLCLEVPQMGFGMHFVGSAVCLVGRI